MQHLRDFVLSLGETYRDLQPANADLHPRSAPGTVADGLDGWAFMMRTADARHALLYFEHGAVPSTLRGLSAAKPYTWTWFNPRTGAWLEPVRVTTADDGSLLSPAFPAEAESPMADWAARAEAAF